MSRVYNINTVNRLTVILTVSRLKNLAVLTTLVVCDILTQTCDIVCVTLTQACDIATLLPVLSTLLAAGQSDTVRVTSPAVLAAVFELIVTATVSADTHWTSSASHSTRSYIQLTISL